MNSLDDDRCVKKKTMTFNSGKFNDNSVGITTENQGKWFNSGNKAVQEFYTSNIWISNKDQDVAGFIFTCV